MGARERAKELLFRVVLGRENGIRSGVRRWAQNGWERVRSRGGLASPFGVDDPGRASTRAPEEEGPEGFHFAARSDEVLQDELLEVTVGGEPLLLTREVDTVFCVSAVCPHAGGALGDGFVESGNLVCPLHGWGFALADGACSVNPSARLSCYEVREEQGRVWVGQRRASTHEMAGNDDA